MSYFRQPFRSAAEINQAVRQAEAHSYATRRSRPTATLSAVRTFAARAPLRRRHTPDVVRSAS